MDFFKLPTNAAIVLVDEVALDFGQLRLKAKGSAGGHNGLKSVQAHFKTQEYSRLRIGVGGEGCQILPRRGVGGRGGRGAFSPSRFICFFEHLAGFSASAFFS